jgi:hypothetical protein
MLLWRRRGLYQTTPKKFTLSERGREDVGQQLVI